MAARYLEGHEKVLEIGANIGRNSLIIASLLEDSKNLVSLECDVNIAKQLAENRDLNNLGFHIENSALSNRKLIQKGLDTIPSDVLIEDYNWVDTISLVDLKAKYNIVFDTLVLDCEGAFYYILMDMPEILDNINVIIMENDYWNEDNKKYIDDVLMKNRFYVDYSAPLLDIYAGYTGPYVNNFYEVWKRVV
jgi:FkbM family methyltransferase